MLDKLCDEYETQRKAIAAAEGEATAIPSILTVILAIIPVLLPMLISGKFDPQVILSILPTLLTALGVPAGLIALAQQIIQAILGLIK